MLKRRPWPSHPQGNTSLIRAPWYVRGTLWNVNISFQRHPPSRSRCASPWRYHASCPMVRPLTGNDPGVTDIAPMANVATMLYVAYRLLRKNSTPRWSNRCCCNKRQHWRIDMAADTTTDTGPHQFPAACPGCGRAENVRAVSVGGLRPICYCTGCDVMWAIPRERCSWTPRDDEAILRQALRRIAYGDG